MYQRRMIRQFYSFRRGSRNDSSPLAKHLKLSNATASSSIASQNDLPMLEKPPVCNNLDIMTTFTPLFNSDSELDHSLQGAPDPPSVFLRSPHQLWAGKENNMQYHGRPPELTSAMLRMAYSVNEADGESDPGWRDLEGEESSDLGVLLGSELISRLQPG